MSDIELYYSCSKLIPEKYEAFGCIGLDAGMQVYFNREKKDQFIIMHSEYGSNVSVSFIKTEVPNRLSFLIPKHCVFIKIQSAEQLKQLIDNAQ